MESQRAQKDDHLKGRNEVQRQLNDCLVYKRNKQAEDDLGRRMDQLASQITHVSTPFFAAATLLHTRPWAAPSVARLMHPGRFAGQILF